MKRIVFMLAVLGVALAVRGQGRVTMNSAGLRAVMKFFDNTADGGAGAWAAGPSYSVARYWGTSASDIHYMSGAPGWFETGGAAGLVLTSTGGGNRILYIDNTPNAKGDNYYLGTAYFQLRAWTGGFATYEQAVASGDPAVVVSVDGPIVPTKPTQQAIDPVAVVPWGGTVADPVIVHLDFLKPGMVNGVVPEPSALALVGFGLTSLIFIRRRRPNISQRNSAQD
jgi:hypothetical protein